jgi:hypothetical protein
MSISGKSCVRCFILNSKLRKFHMLPTHIYQQTIIDYQAITLLTTLLTSGTAVLDSPAYLPTPSHLALCATLSTHPTLTTRAKTPEKVQASQLALSFLKLTNILVGPVAANFDKAFDFKYFDSGSRRGGRRNGTLADEGNDGPELDLEIAGSGSIWTKSEDFWAVVGWAFNCSVVHKRRWEVWEGWLGFMLDVLEADWEDRVRSGDSGHGCEKMLQASLIVKYLEQGSGGYGKVRRIMRSIFADGSTESMKEFREIYKNEPKELKKKDKDGGIKKREVSVNIDEEVYGDYLEDDKSDSDASATIAPNSVTNPIGRPTPLRHARSKTRSRSISKPGSKPRSENESPSSTSPYTPPTPLGPISALCIRLRLLSLLTAISTHLPNAFLSISSLNNLITEHIRPLPVPLFSLLVLPSTISPTLPIPLLLNTLDSYIATPHQPPSSFTPLTQSTLQTSCLPYVATTATLADNTKLSILLESMLRRLASEGKLRMSEDLREAVEQGVRDRAEKVQSGGGRAGNKKGTADDWENGFVYLAESGERMGWCLDGLEE